MAVLRAWTEGWFRAPGSLPVTFTYGDQRVAGIPAGWSPQVQSRRVDANIVETIYRGREPRTGLEIRVEALAYADYPVVEWTAWLTNGADGPSEMIGDLRVLDAPIAARSPVLYHCNGDFQHEEGYTPEETPLEAGTRLEFAPHEGRPSDGAFPYFRLAFAGVGLTLAVGWPGQWAASFAAGESGVHVQAGQQTVHLRLQPGETIRSPRMTLLAWIGDGLRGMNLWRRWYRSHVLPRPDGRPLQPLVACSNGDGGIEFTQAAEENQLRFIQRYADAGIDFDIWWIDAGWYPCLDSHGERNWVETGTWHEDSERFPRGLRPISEAAARRGARLLIWFEPERVVVGTGLDREHPEWLLGRRDPNDEWLARNRLLDLGNPECRQWLTDHVCRLIQERGIGVYRQDFNFQPLRYWRDNEAPDRQGMVENLHVQGYLRYWDDLLARNPGLWIDSCASGGRRNDLETMRRSVPLHYSDYGYGLHTVKLAFQHTLYAWIPYFKEPALSWERPDAPIPAGVDPTNDPFGYHCAMAPMLNLSMDIRRDDIDMKLAHRMIALWRRASPILVQGDYYPLTAHSRAADRWVVRQFDWPERGIGLVQGIRLQNCEQEQMTVQLHALDPDAVYVFENPETGEGLEQHGGDAFTFALPARTGALWLYRVRDRDVAAAQAMHATRACNS